MELDDLLKEEGLDAHSVEGALEWARRRADELCVGVEQDPELGPLLVGAAAVPSVPVGTRPAVDLKDEEPASLETITAHEFVGEPAVQPVAEPIGEPAVQPDVPEEPGSPEAISTYGDDVEGAAESSAGDDTAQMDVAVPDDEGAAADEELAAAEAAVAAAAAELAAVEAESEAAEATAGGPDDTASVAGEGTVEAHADASGEAEQPEVSEGGEEEPAELDPLAGIDFDDLPGVEEDADEVALSQSPLGGQSDHGEPDVTNPAMLAPDVTQSMDGHQLANAGADVTQSMDAHQFANAGVDVTQSMDAHQFDESRADVTERAVNPLLLGPPGEAPEAEAAEVSDAAPHAAVPAATSGGTLEMPAVSSAVGTGEMPAVSSAEGDDEDEEEIEELDDFELLDDDDLELVEDDEDEAGSSEVPEWQAALSSAQMGGGSQADQDSGLLERPTAPPSESPEGSGSEEPDVSDS